MCKSSLILMNCADIELNVVVVAESRSQRDSEL